MTETIIVIGEGDRISVVRDSDGDTSIKIENAGDEAGAARWIRVRVAEDVRARAISDLLVAVTVLQRPGRTRGVTRRVTFDFDDWDVHDTLVTALQEFAARNHWDAEAALDESERRRHRASEAFAKELIARIEAA